MLDPRTNCVDELNQNNNGMHQNECNTRTIEYWQCPGVVVKLGCVCNDKSRTTSILSYFDSFVAFSPR